MESNPRKIDFLSINLSNISLSTEALGVCGGVVIDMMNMPSMSAEELDGMLVAIRSLVGLENHLGFLMELAGLILFTNHQHTIIPTLQYV